MSMPTEITFRIEGQPITKKNSQEIFNNPKGRPFIVQSKQSRLWAEKAAWQLRTQWHGRPPITGDVNLAARVYRAKAIGDLVGFIQAIQDVLEEPSAASLKKKRKKPPAKASIIKNDRQVVSLDGSRLLKDAVHPRVEIILTVLDPTSLVLPL